MLQFERLVFSSHALQRTFERGISVDAVKGVMTAADIIEDYPQDQPYPSCLVLGWADERPLHVVAALDATSGTC